ncbi:MAG: selenocysteine-specific translation elongation factor [Pirellulales bacterium]|nr:selenocysteine-specific translation elongation factor [Pirellulales bacterium]
MSYTIVGVIGHIDHGKTSLVGVLTGTDTDTHPEEKLRGITIDLGFASFQQDGDEFALIDAPGHQKYIGNLLAGVSGIDVGLLVVACDQGIQEQTLEHAAILQSLGVRKLIAAISRIDLSDEAKQLELAEELEVFLADYGFENVPTLPFSSVTGQGIDALKQQLRDYARTSDRSSTGFFRMPIDRVFSVPGRGCVVAGTLWSGNVKVGDTVEVVGSDQPVRVRELEVHGRSVERSAAGHRTAMNLTGVSAHQLARGDELVAQGTNRPVTRMVVEINAFRESSPVKCPATIQLHSATTACSARITGVRGIEPGEKTVAVLDVEQPVFATYGQQFLLRCPYPVGSFGGGRVLAPLESHLGLKRHLVEFGQQLAGADPVARLVAWVSHLGEWTVDPVTLELHLGIARDNYAQVVDAAVDSGKLQMPVEQRLVATSALERAGGYLVKLLTRQAEETDDAWVVQESLIEKARSTGSPQVVRHVIDRLVEEKRIVRFNKMLAIASEDNLLSKKQRARMNEIVAMFDGDRTPPTIKEVAEKFQTKMDAIASLIRFATQQRLLIDLGNGFLLSAEMFQQLCRELVELFKGEQEFSVAEIRDHWKITRKHAVPFLEYCDRVGATTRKDNTRIAGPKLQQIVSEQFVE